MKNIANHYAVAEKFQSGYFDDKGNELSKIRKVVDFINAYRFLKSDIIFEKFDFFNITFSKRLEKNGLITKMYSEQQDQYYYMLGTNARYVITHFFPFSEYHQFSLAIDENTRSQVLFAINFALKEQLQIREFGYDYFVLSNHILLVFQATKDTIDIDQIDAMWTDMIVIDDELSTAPTDLYNPRLSEQKKKNRILEQFQKK